MTEFLLNIRIDPDSDRPKYKQLVDAIIRGIEHGQLGYGQKIPSINNLSAEFHLSRDTVEKSYMELKRIGVIQSVRGKGFYIQHANPLSKIRVMLLFNKISAYKKVIYNNIINMLGDKAEVRLYVYHCEASLFKKILEEKKRNYDYLVVMPHFKSEKEHDEIRHILESISPKKLFILDKHLARMDGDFGEVVQDFKEDIYKALDEAKPLLEKYNKINLVFPKKVEHPYPLEIMQGFRNFVVNNNFAFEIMDEIPPGHSVNEGEVYITIEETDLVNIIKAVKDSDNLELGKNIGIISYNDTPLKEVLANGITVITTDFEEMGVTVAQMILNKVRYKTKNTFRLIKRNSL